MLLQCEYSNWNTMFYLKNNYDETIDSQVIAVPSEDYALNLAHVIDRFLDERDIDKADIHYVGVRISDLRSAPCENTAVLEAQLSKNLGIEVKDFTEYSKQ